MKEITLFFPTQPGLVMCAPGYKENPLFFDINSGICYFYSILPVSKSILSIPILPDGCMDIVFIENDTKTKAYLIGTGTHISGFDIIKEHAVFGIRFQPGGLQKYFNIDAKEVRNIQIELNLVCKEVDELCEKLFGAKSIEEKAEISIQFLGNYRKDYAEKNELIRYCVDEVYKNKGHLNIQDLAEKTMYSERYIEKTFNQNVGLSPKVFSDICRIQMTIQHVQNHPNQNMLQVACDYGYVDHAHLNKHLKKYLHISAGKLLDEKIFTPHEEGIDIKYIL